MKQTFKLAKDVYSFLSYKGLPFPGSWFPWPQGPTKPNGGNFTYPNEAPILKTQSELGVTLRKETAPGVYYFMPVVFIHEGKSYEIPNAVIGYNCKKNIVETTMAGRKGTVKELVSVDDYEINIAGAAVSSDWPEAKIKELNELFNINEAIEIKSALTELFLEADTKVIIKSIDFAEMSGTETVQTVKINCVTDRSFELIIK